MAGSSMALTPTSATEHVHRSIPALSRLGLVVDAIAPGAVDLRVPIAGNANHMGTLYAGALFAVAELPGGLLPATVLGVAGYVPMVTEVQVRFVAAARTDVTVSARLAPAELRALGERADACGEAGFSLDVRARDEAGRTVLTSSAHYLLRPARRTGTGPA